MGGTGVVWTGRDLPAARTGLQKSLYPGGKGEEREKGEGRGVKEKKGQKLKK